MPQNKRPSRTIRPDQPYSSNKNRAIILLASQPASQLPGKPPEKSIDLNQDRNEKRVPNLIIQMIQFYAQLAKFSFIIHVIIIQESNVIVNSYFQRERSL